MLLVLLVVLLVVLVLLRMENFNEFVFIERERYFSAFAVRRIIGKSFLWCWFRYVVVVFNILC